MGLEDLAAFRAVHGSTVLYPCDANQTARLVATMADLDGISYLRTTRGATPVVYGPDEDFPVGASKVLRHSASDAVTVVAAGITLHEAAAAADRLEAEGVAIRLIDAYSVKPIDAATLVDAARATEGRMVTVEDHWAEGGLGDAVLAALAPHGLALRVEKLAVREMPHSGSPEDLLRAAQIDADAIVGAVSRQLRAPLA
jgi:transketolase